MTASTEEDIRRRAEIESREPRLIDATGDQTTSCGIHRENQLFDSCGCFWELRQNRCVRPRDWRFRHVPKPPGLPGTVRGTGNSGTGA